MAKSTSEFVRLSEGFAIWLFCQIKINVRWKACKYNFGYIPIGKWIVYFICGEKNQSSRR